jgi:hypothetical protein
MKNDAALTNSVKSRRKEDGAARGGFCGVDDLTTCCDIDMSLNATGRFVNKDGTPYRKP